MRNPRTDRKICEKKKIFLCASFKLMNKHLDYSETVLDSSRLEVWICHHSHQDGKLEKNVNLNLKQLETQLMAYLLICQQLLADVTWTVLTAIIKLSGMFRGDSKNVIGWHTEYSFLRNALSKIILNVYKLF